MAEIWAFVLSRNVSEHGAAQVGDGGYYNAGVWALMQNGFTTVCQVPTFWALSMKRRTYYLNGSHNQSSNLFWRLRIDGHGITGHISVEFPCLLRFWHLPTWRVTVWVFTKTLRMLGQSSRCFSQTLIATAMNDKICASQTTDFFQTECALKQSIEPKKSKMESGYTFGGQPGFFGDPDNLFPPQKMFSWSDLQPKMAFPRNTLPDYILWCLFHQTKYFLKAYYLYVNKNHFAGHQMPEQKTARATRILMATDATRNQRTSFSKARVLAVRCVHCSIAWKR